MQTDLFMEAPQTTIAPSQPEKSVTLSTSLRQHSASIDTALQSIFKTSHEETRIQQARRVMGEEVASLSDEELEVCLTEFQHLIDQWLDAFEQGVFGGQTLKQVLGQA